MNENMMMQEILQALAALEDGEDLEMEEIRNLIELYDKDLYQLVYIAYAVGFKRGKESA